MYTVYATWVPSGRDRMVLIGARSRLSLPLRGSRQLPPRACLHVLDESEVASLPQRFVLFTDLHVQRSTLPVCVQLLRKVATEAHARSAARPSPPRATRRRTARPPRAKAETT